MLSVDSKLKSPASRNLSYAPVNEKNNSVIEVGDTHQYVEI